MFTVFVFTAIFLLGLLSVKESTAGEAWVANMKGANVQIIDTDSNKVVKPFLPEPALIMSLSAQTANWPISQTWEPIA